MLHSWRFTLSVSDILGGLVKTVSSEDLEGVERSLILGGLTLSGSDILGGLVENPSSGDFEGF